MEDEVTRLQGKLSEIAMQLENFVPSAEAASELKAELQTVLVLLDSMTLFSAQPA